MILYLPNSTASDPVPPADAFSSNSACPNEPASFYATLGDSLERAKACRASASAAGEDYWNPAGSNLAMESFDFPIFLSDAAVVEESLIENCYRAFNEPNKETGEAKVRSEQAISRMWCNQMVWDSCTHCD